MGNHLVGVAPSQIYPVEHYFTGSFENDLRYESSMGSTRFFKVARARIDEGLMVVKVFVKHDPTLPLDKHCANIDDIKKGLANAVNCLPFQRIMTEKAGLLMREYVKHSLYDRVSTRPFLTTLEKKWITFQVLCALNQCHKQKICHGDIKLENILITSWNWILLSDFASFKPTYLPDDNPADYTFFFDTSRRRTCYIAPERFVKSNDGHTAPGAFLPNSSDDSKNAANEDLVRDGATQTGKLLPEMDIFSAGCALLELWSEGTAPFEFSQLLAYRAGEMELVKKHLSGIQNGNLANLISSMISLNPEDRKSAEIYLDEERGRLFPDYFYTFLQPYLQIFSSNPVLPPDEKMLIMHQDINQLLNVCSYLDENDNVRCTDNDGLILAIGTVTSCIRGLQHSKSRLRALEILRRLAERTTSETILDRILPYILHLALDTSPTVRVCAIETLTACLELVKELPRSDANVFLEYILPSISHMATDSAVAVRVSCAKNIAALAETAVRYLDQTQLNSPTEMPAHRYETELTTLHEMFAQTVSYLLTDAHPIVKQTLIESGITKLCVFFGRQKANDLVLSHMITFLNDKEDSKLRGAFFDCIVGVAGYVGWQCSDILIPLLQQGLTDMEEFVIAKSIRATTSLTELGLIQKTGLSAFIGECACYLNHPNLWIRHEIAGLISMAASTFGPIDVQCKIMPAISGHLKCPLIQVERSEILLDCLHPPIPRSIFDSVVRFPDIQQLFEVLAERRQNRDVGGLPHNGEMSVTVRNFIRRLTSDAMTELVELQLLASEAYLLKLNRYKAAEAKRNADGKIQLDKRPGICHEYIMNDKNNIFDPRKLKSDNDTSTSDWQHMPHMYPTSERVVSVSSPSGESAVSTGLISNSAASSTNHIPSSSLVEYSMPERSFREEYISECRRSLQNLRSKIKVQYQQLAATRDFDTAIEQRDLPANWRMKGTLVAHLHEHQSAVTKMISLTPNGPLFISASTDCTVRLWDCNKLDGCQSINKSRHILTTNTPLYSIAVCDAGLSLVMAGKDCSLSLARIDATSSKMAMQENKPYPTEHGPVVDMQSMDNGSPSIVVYATLYGTINCWDLRMPDIAWRQQTELRHGVITTFCVDPTSSWMATGTSGGKHIVWDLRFRLPIAEIRHPYDYRIRKVAAHPTEPSWLISASHGNNEVSIWNIETGHREGALWASNAPPLTKETNLSPSTVCGLATGTIDRSPYILTGGADQRIRFWDLGAIERPRTVLGDQPRARYLSSPNNCALVVPAARDNNSELTYTYDSRLIDGTAVLYEVPGNSSAASQASNASRGSGTAGTAASGSSANNAGSVGSGEEQQPRSGPEQPSAGHNDVIGDLLVCRTQKQTFVASASRDGVIKLWK